MGEAVVAPPVGFFGDSDFWRLLRRGNHARMVSGAWACWRRGGFDILQFLPTVLVWFACKSCVGSPVEKVGTVCVLISQSRLKCDGMNRRVHVLNVSLCYDAELGPESLKVPGLDLQMCGLQVWCWLDIGVIASSPFPCGGDVPFRLMFCHWLWLVCMNCWLRFDLLWCALVVAQFQIVVPWWYLMVVGWCQSRYPVQVIASFVWLEVA
ncbi:hypothetical protein Taro_048591 [Colocasia esculenta]|uniref:Uncharacterized protein n=1 Tax=Colocasia esculenta TaxID=4460 RepID=A0A843X8J6_COLES|nr:hypothetical protein [Colocasia esculenta]